MQGRTQRHEHSNQLNALQWRGQTPQGYRQGQRCIYEDAERIFYSKDAAKTKKESKTVHSLENY